MVTPMWTRWGSGMGCASVLWSSACGGRLGSRTRCLLTRLTTILIATSLIGFWIRLTMLHTLRWNLALEPLA
jgi:hypothetical protein